MSMRIFTLIINEIFIRAPKIMRNVAKASFSICEQSWLIHVVPSPLQHYLNHFEKTKILKLYFQNIINNVGNFIFPWNPWSPCSPISSRGGIGTTISVLISPWTSWLVGISDHLRPIYLKPSTTYGLVDNQPEDSDSSMTSTYLNWLMVMNNQFVIIIWELWMYPCLHGWKMWQIWMARMHLDERSIT